MRFSTTFGFISPSLATYLKFNIATTPEKQAVAVLKHIDCETGVETEAISFENLKIVVIKIQAFHTVEKTWVYTSFFEHKSLI